jgi:hypothetical protein
MGGWCSSAGKKYLREGIIYSPKSGSMDNSMVSIDPVKINSDGEIVSTNDQNIYVSGKTITLPEYVKKATGFLAPI